MSRRREHKTFSEIPEEEKKELRAKTNRAISRYCGFAALVIIIITFASFIVERGDDFSSQCGIMISIALLAISIVNNPDRS